MTWTVLNGDCIDQLAALDEASVDAIVTDPPYGLGFMGKEWDDLPPGLEFAEQALQVLKPGGHLLAFGGSRTYHRLACAVEDAGFEIRDQMMWLYGSGFPKSLDVSKAIDKAAGAEREVVGQKRHARKGVAVAEERTAVGAGAFGEERIGDVTAPATPEAERWNGWGTALKPAHEPIVVARKPLSGTVAENVLAHGTGGLNIDGCRIGTAGGTTRDGESDRLSAQGAFTTGHEVASIDAGRWPANVVLDEEAGRLLDEQSGTLNSPKQYTKSAAGFQSEYVGGEAKQSGLQSAEYGDTGGASRFFYCAKASKGERNAGLDELEPREGDDVAAIRPKTRKCRVCGSSAKQPGPNGRYPSCGHDDWEYVENAESRHKGEMRNHHPTVKPIELMRYLCRLVTPPGGTVLDPFLGSGTTGCAAVLEGFDFIGIEREAEYVAICEARIAWWEKHRGEGLTDEVLKAAGVRDEVEQAGQLGLLDQAA